MHWRYKERNSCDFLRFQGCSSDQRYGTLVMVHGMQIYEVLIKFRRGTTSKVLSIVLMLLARVLFPLRRPCISGNWRGRKCRRDGVSRSGRSPFSGLRTRYNRTSRTQFGPWHDTYIISKCLADRQFTRFYCTERL